jgi:hypothetical protein
LNDVVSRSVDLGYRVVDEYIRQGQRAAQRFGERSFGPEAVVTETREMADRMAQYASDALSLWFEVLELAGTSGAWRGMAAAADGLRAGAMPTSAGNGVASSPTTGDAIAPVPLDRTRVSIEVVSPHPTEVALDLGPEANAGALVVHGLRATDPEKPRLVDVTLRADSEGAPLRLRIRIPEDQPGGTYSGLIVDERSSRPVGTLTVRISRA